MLSLLLFQQFLDSNLGINNPAVDASHEADLPTIFLISSGMLLVVMHPCQISIPISIINGTKLAA